MLAMVSKICIAKKLGAQMRVQLSCYDNALDLRSALVNLRHLGIAEESLDGILLHVTVSAENLDRLRRDPHGGLARHELGHRAELSYLLSAIAGGGGRMEQCAGRSDFHGHVRQPELDRLKFLDRFAELASLRRVLRGVRQRGLRDPDRLRADAQPPRAERLNGVNEAESGL